MKEEREVAFFQHNTLVGGVICIGFPLNIDRTLHTR